MKMTVENVRNWAPGQIDVNKKIESIKRFRTYFGADLRNSKDMVELFIVTHYPENNSFNWNVRDYEIQKIIDRHNGKQPASLGDILGAALQKNEQTYMFKCTDRILHVVGKEAAQTLKNQLKTLGVIFIVYQKADLD